MGFLHLAQSAPSAFALAQQSAFGLLHFSQAVPSALALEQQLWSAAGASATAAGATAAAGAASTAGAAAGASVVVVDAQPTVNASAMRAMIERMIVS